MSDPQTFTPRAEARELAQKLYGNILNQGTDEFISIWEANGETSDPREAGSMVAHGYMTIAARIAVFSCQCARVEPRKEQWMALASEMFDKAVKDVTDAIEKAEDEEHG